MTAEFRIERAKGVDVFEVEIVVSGEHAVEAERGVALAQHEQIAIRHVRTFGIVAHGLVDRAQHLHDGERRRDMAMSALVRNGQYLRPDLSAELVHCKTTYDTRAVIGWRSSRKSQAKRWFPAVVAGRPGSFPWRFRAPARTSSDAE